MMTADKLLQRKQSIGHTIYEIHINEFNQHFNGNYENFLPKYSLIFNSRHNEITCMSSTKPPMRYIDFGDNLRNENLKLISIICFI